MIEIVPYRPEWVADFGQLSRQLRRRLGELALRIDHIGSTSVPGLAAKDIIDIQITVATLTPTVASAMERAGYVHRSQVHGDHLPPGAVTDPEQWRKWLFKPAGSGRPANVHIRMPGRSNQRYALLFRDYLRAHPQIAEAYAQVKRAIAAYHPEEDMNAYYAIKDPVCDIVMGGAEQWAAATGWQPGTSDA